MTRISRCLILLPIAAAFSACSSSSTGPGGTTTNNYVGTIASPAATGSFTATMITSASGDRVAESPGRAAGGPSGQRIAEGSVTTASVTITLLSGQTLTLTGTLNGTLFSVGDNSTPQNVCAGSLAPQLSATCTIFGIPGIPLTGVLTAGAFNGVLASYCGVETPAGGPTTPDAYLYIGIATPYALLARVASADNSISFYADQNATASAFTADLGGSTTDFFSGNYSVSLASGTHTVGGNVVGNWTAVSPCALIPPSLSGGGSANFTAVVGAAPANQVIVVSPPTVGALTAVVVPATATWLTATVSANTVILSAASQTSATPVGSPLTATVDVWPQFASGPLPVQIPVTYTVLSTPPPVLSGDNNALVFSMSAGAGAPAALTDNISVTGGAAQLVQPVITYPPAPAPQNWLTTNTISSLVIPSSSVPLTVTPTSAVSGFSAGGPYTANIVVASTTPGVAPLMVSVSLNVAAAGPCAITGPANLTLYEGNYDYFPIGFTGSGCPAPFSYVWNISGQPTGMLIVPDIDAIQGTPATGTNTNGTVQHITLGTGALATLTINYTVGAQQSCNLGPANLPGGTAGKNYGYSIVPSTACITANGVYKWIISGNAGSGLDLAAGAQGTPENYLSGTAASGTWMISIMFVNSDAILPKPDTTIHAYQIVVQ